MTEDQAKEMIHLLSDIKGELIFIREGLTSTEKSVVETGRGIKQQLHQLQLDLAAQHRG